MWRKVVYFALWIALLAGFSTWTQAQTLDLERIRRATVLILQTNTIAGRAVTTCVGSGTIVDRSGLIATNAHNTVTNQDCPGDNLIIALSISPDEAPIPTYRAEIAQVDEGLDLALLRITEELNGRQVDATTLNLPFVAPGDSSQIALDDTITVVGYPGLGSEAVTSVRGTIRSFIAEPSGGERAWMKTDATIPGTMTGGGVYSQSGQLIGLPTRVPVISIAPESSNCVALEDTTGDGLVNANDTCIPTGGFINALRPSNFMRPLLRGASLGLSVEKLAGANVQLNIGDEPAFSRLIVSPSVSDGMPTTVARNLPIGTNRMYLFFDYRNMTPETIYELRVSIDSSPNATYSLAPVRWSGGSSGLWYIGIGGENQTLPNGVYELTLSINGQFADSTSIIVGVSSEDEPTFSNIFFCIEDGVNCYGDVYVLPTGNVVSARFIHRNMTEGISWAARWLYNDAEIPGSRIETAWETQPRDTMITRLEDPAGLPAGRYRLELYIQDRLAATADFTIAGASEGAFSRIFSDVRLTSGNSIDEAITGSPISSFAAGVRNIYVVFNWEQLAPGTLWTMRWLVDNTVFYEETVPWNALDSGQNYVARLSGINGIPDGTYRMELDVNGVTFDNTIVEAEVGIGQLSIDVLAQTSGVQMNGKIIDAETREGIPGVSFILISEDFSVSDFVWDQEQVYAIAVTDRNGQFQLDRLLEYESPYSLVIVAQGYLPIMQDGIVVGPDTPNPITIEIPLTRD